MSVVIDGTNGVTSDASFYGKTPFTGTYTDGIVVDYTTGTGRITVGASDGLKIRNNGISSPVDLVTVDSSGNVGIGVAPSAWGSNYAKAIQLSTQGAYVAANTSTYSAGTYAWFGNNAYLDSSAVFRYTTSTASAQYAQVAGAHQWFNAPSGTAGNAITFTQAMTLDSSGNLLVGVTSDTNVPTTGVTLRNSSGTTGNIGVGHASGVTNGNPYINFAYNGSGIGSITQNGTTGVLYNLTSDYRLKNDQQPLTGAKEFVMALQPKKWQWWDGSGEGVGFIAHEFMEVAKYSGHGEKDAVDEEGNIIPQSIQPSSSEVMANLVSLLQEQQAIIEQLRADVETLKGKA